jgi:hypothetical protein
MPLPILAAFALLGIHPEDQEPVYARASVLMRAMQYVDPRMRDQIARARNSINWCGPFFPAACDGPACSRICSTPVTPAI